jgi:hypothetical protein
MNPRTLTRAACAIIAAIALATCQLSAAGAAVPGGMGAINPVVKTSAQFCPQQSNSSEKSLCGLGISVSQGSQYESFVACLGCTAAGWGQWSKTGETWAAKGTQPINSRASVLLVMTKPGDVGRYLVYRPTDVNTPHAGLKLHSEGCIGADIPADTIRKSFHGTVQNLPTVQCKPPKHLTSYVATAGLNELSTSTLSHVLVYGRAAKKSWLTMEEQPANTACKPDPLAYSQSERRSNPTWVIWHVKGEFEDGFRTRALHPAGRYCIYLQTGNEYDGLPDGWTVEATYVDYSTGDVLTGPSSTTLAAAGATTVTLSGDAPRTETLQSYDLLKPCPEYSGVADLASFGGSTMQVSGAFTETLTTATFKQSGYVCSYLHGNGYTVALSTDQVSVAGTQLKVQSQYAETAFQNVTPMSDPVGNAGTAGAAITAGQTVYVRCILNGLGLAPFDPVWYELASTPWGDAYYAPAFAFYNNGQTSGTAVNSPRWDSAVPFCESL